MLARQYCSHRKREISMSYSYREAALNWLALGLLLAAWNGSDDAGASRDVLSVTRDVPERPAALRAYPQVSVRGATRAAVINRGFTAL
jgi:hypothetical protein